MWSFAHYHAPVADKRNLHMQGRRIDISQSGEGMSNWRQKCVAFSLTKLWECQPQFFEVLINGIMSCFLQACGEIECTTVLEWHYFNVPSSHRIIEICWFIPNTAIRQGKINFSNIKGEENNSMIWLFVINGVFRFYTVYWMCDFMKLQLR